MSEQISPELLRAYQDAYWGWDKSKPLPKKHPRKERVIVRRPDPPSNAGKFQRDHPELYDPELLKQLKAELISEYGRVCMCCGSTEKIVLEHIVSRCHGGSNDKSNLQLLCWLCNFRKGHKPIDYRPK